MKKRTKIILSVGLILLLSIGIVGYAYVSDYYHADKTALEAMARRMGTAFPPFQARNRFGKLQKRSQLSLDTLSQSPNSSEIL